MSVLELKEDQSSRQDILFIRKVRYIFHIVHISKHLRVLTGVCVCVLTCVQHAQRLYRHIYLTCKEESSGRDHYQALFTLLAVLGVELSNEEVLVDLIRLVLALQVGRIHNRPILSLSSQLLGCVFAATSFVVIVPSALIGRSSHCRPTSA